jgi:hypothetical protein
LFCGRKNERQHWLAARLAGLTEQRHFIVVLHLGWTNRWAHLANPYFAIFNQQRFRKTSNEFQPRKPRPSYPTSLLDTLPKYKVYKHLIT